MTNHRPCTVLDCNRPACAKGLCRQHYSREWELAHSDPAVAGRGRGYRGTLAERFWRKVRRDGPTQQHMESACWEWTGSKHGDGYGVIVINGKSTLAHRVSFALAGNALPDDVSLRHRCDHRPCIRPDHLLTGSQTENVADMHERGRHVPSPGERNGRARLTMADVAAARAEHATGCSIAALARKYGMSESAMGSAVKGQSWRDPDAPSPYPFHAE